MNEYIVWFKDGKTSLRLKADDFVVVPGADNTLVKFTKDGNVIGVFAFGEIAGFLAAKWKVE